MELKIPVVLTLLCFAGIAYSQTGVITPGEASKKTRNTNPAFAKVIDDPALPRVLIIGDSISIGYTAETRELLSGKVNLHRVPGNAGDTGIGIAGLSKWLDPKKGKWDLIHFNWGLWDLCYRHPESKNQGKRDKEKGTLTFTPDAYAANLEKIITELKKTGAILVFATTTPVPEGEAGRKLGDDEIYNKAALEVMKRHDIAITDLHAIMEGKMDRYARAAGDVHFTEEGSALLAAAVAKSIESNLEAKRP
ncbi:SGNH/GDSL hydrolase family protein [Verrucomicrobiales bacterium BCK34]|nr:SGNH/GDSL hydrolase family protein [Verrucomicrobiales bacterium BCK34]